ncbi:hypothetical protein F0M03_22775 [Vibrio parahaemolyticus]|uniref:ABC-three component system protein n=1 Tax=Vibrio TaxID=662 RepID=UPI001299CB53|nr:MULTISPECIES: ABC-three component system protein [Vibrio harveyi group]EJB8586892.1 hypothetical protein [Vibrio parahaemolyticus]MDF5123408.1 hypothetical protein [Vibrio parahaemolyticus]MDF5682132.1 hypothetical protein [Vibrio parahaemolyticus]MRE05930.1 hypothetical protein [Vibrio parahaemolyticus]NMT58352.1 hypothetical protein [Vibrio parahaemolyticus]
MCDHRAAFSKLGYLYQIRYALYRAVEDTDAYFIKLESLDDVEVKKTTEHELFQLKHHTGDDRLSNKSVDLWKTIGIWSEQIIKGSVVQEELKYYLATTSEIPEKSIASLLTTRNRDVKEAIHKLDATAKEINNKRLADSVSNFSKLTPEQKEVMCQSIFILGKEENSRDIVKKIKRRLELTVNSNFIDSLYERLEGWWFNIVISFLLGDKDKIWRNEVVQKVIDLSYDYHPDSLPVDFEFLEIEDEERDGFLDYQFVKQLELIGVGTERIHNAILDYYRAYHQRSKWVTDDLSIEHDVANYEKRLKDDWSRFRLSIIDELEDADEKEIKKAGRTILNWVETQADIRIRKKVSQRFIMLGSYHILANKTPPLLGWHPHFKTKLEEILCPPEVSHANQ